MKPTGFTLIELIVSIALGLIVVATALMLFLSGQRNINLQNAATTIQEDQNFGLSYIARQIRMANLNSSQAIVNNTIAQSGIVFSSSNLSSFISGFTHTYASRADAISSNVQTRTGNAAFADATSDQLVIQYRPAESGGYDCEGNVINNKNIYIVERYFVRLDANTESHETNNELKKSLACAASRYASDISTSTVLAAAGAGIYGNGQIILKRVDLFKVSFLVDASTATTTNLRYMTLGQYNDLAGIKPRIVAVQLGIISRSTQPANDAAVIVAEQQFRLMGFDVKVKTNQPAKYARAPIMQTVALRNALGDR